MTNANNKAKDRERGKIALRQAMRAWMRSALLVLVLFGVLMITASAAEVNVDIGGDAADTIDIIGTMTLLALIPTILIMTTCFTRVVIVLSFMRNAIGLQQTPPNQVLIGIALFLSLFIMSPVISQINTEAYEPYANEEITQAEFIEKAQVPLREFMLKQTKKSDLNLFVELAGQKDITDMKELPMTTIIPAFMASELKRAFLIGFLIYIPFLIIDLIVSSILMSLGMIMLSPAMVSLPFKLLLFVLVDGWGLLFKTLAASFQF